MNRQSKAAPGWHREAAYSNSCVTNFPQSRSSAQPVETLLSRLQGVRQTGGGRWLARCPAHEDRTPSLSIRETEGGTILLRCFAGCGAVEVVQAVGLELRDLFPPRLPESSCTGKRAKAPIPWVDVFRAIETDLTAAALAFSDLAAGKPFSEDDSRFISAKAADLVDQIRSARHG